MTLETLKSCRTIRGEIESLTERIARLRSQAERLTRPLSLAPGGGEQRDELAEYAARLDALERDRAGKVIALEERLQEVDCWLSTLPAQQARVMRLRYVDGLRTWGDVAKKANYSVGHCRKIHAVAKKKMDTQCALFL
ncbi:MAG TPA: ECF-type sigma factor [Clostridia bacterium]|nr:ECF-type sigma factor [Clostridia bacterium]